MAFHVGQRVVCVNDSLVALGPAKPGKCFHRSLNGLKRGEVYTVDWYSEAFEDEYWAPQPAIFLREIHRPCGVPFSVHRFRPLRSTNISIFTSMLTPSPKRVRA